MPVQLRRARRPPRVIQGAHQMLRDQPGQMGRGAQRAPVQLGQPEDGVLARHDRVRVAHQAYPAAQAESLHRRDHGCLALVHRGEGVGAALVRADQRPLSVRLYLLDVHARVEPPALGGQHHAADLGVAARRAHGLGQRGPAGHRERVDRREVDGDHGNPFFRGRTGDTHGRISYLSTKHLLGAMASKLAAATDQREALWKTRPRALWTTPGTTRPAPCAAAPSSSPAAPAGSAPVSRGPSPTRAPTS
ncbi:protein of unknown function [Streptomyces murinus]